MVLWVHREPLFPAHSTAHRFLGQFTLSASSRGNFRQRHAYLSLILPADGNESGSIAPKSIANFRNRTTQDAAPRSRQGCTSCVDCPAGTVTAPASSEIHDLWTRNSAAGAHRYLSVQSGMAARAPLKRAAVAIAQLSVLAQNKNAQLSKKQQGERLRALLWLALNAGRGILQWPPSGSAPRSPRRSRR